MLRHTAVSLQQVVFTVIPIWMCVHCKMGMLLCYRRDRENNLYYCILNHNSQDRHHWWRKFTASRVYCDFHLHVHCKKTSYADILCWRLVLTSYADILCWHLVLTSYADILWWHLMLTSYADILCLHLIFTSYAYILCWQHIHTLEYITFKINT